MTVPPSDGARVPARTGGHEPGHPAVRGGVVLVTGAAGGIGTAVVARLVHGGYHVLATDLAPAVEEMAGDGVDAVVADLADGEGRAAVVEAVGERTLRGVVHLAGITRDALLPKLGDDDVRLVLRVNAVSPIALTLAVRDRLAEGASIVFTTSRAQLGNIGQVNYAASKGAVVGAAIALSRSLAPTARVNALAPGLIRTAMTAAMPEHVLAKLVARVPLDRMGAPEDVAAAVAHLLSDDAAYVTGQVVYVCGGRSR